MQSIRVAVRLRPEEKEKETSSLLSSSSCVDANETTNALKIAKNKDGGGSESFDFTFDNVWGTDTSQEAIFEEVKTLINESLQGFSVTIFAFGMTGSGKTYTIAGTPQQPGIVPRAVRHIFTDLQRNANKASDSVAMVYLTYVELYNNVLYDLLAPDLPLGEDSSGLRLHEHPKKGVVITGSPTIRTPVSSAHEALQLISRGNKLRATSATNMNERSSRSHTVISFEIVSRDGKNSSAKVGKINFVDLAGSERVKLSGAEGHSLEEAKQINKALSVLGDVLNSLSKFHQNNSNASITMGKEDVSEGSTSKTTAMVDVKASNGLSLSTTCHISTTTAMTTPHVPYRNSKLTMLLKDSLGGNAKTMMIATIRQSSIFYPQSLLTLRYAARARHIKCSPIQNVATIGGDEEENAHTVQETMQQVHRLQHLLDQRNTEFHELQMRVKDFQRGGQGGFGRGEGGGDGNSGGEDMGQYKEQLERLRSRSAKERQELQEQLRCVIRSHEGTLATKEKAFVALEEQLKEQSQQIKSLQKDKQTAILSKIQSESMMEKLHTKITEQEDMIVQLRKEKHHLEQQMVNINERLALTADSTSEREQLVHALQNVTTSRNKHKKHAEELQKQIQQLMQDKQRNEKELTRAQLLLEENRATSSMISDPIVETLSKEQKLEKEKLVSDEQQQQQQQQMNELLNELTRVQSQRDQLQSDYEQRTMDITILTDTVTSLRTHIDEMEQQLKQQGSDNQKQIADLQQHQQSSVDQLAAVEAAAKVAVTTAEATATAAQRQYQADKETWTAEKSHCKTQIKALSMELKDSLRRESEAREISDTRFGELQKMMMTVNATNVALEKYVEELQQLLLLSRQQGQGQQGVEAGTDSGEKGSMSIPPGQETEGGSVVPDGVSVSSMSGVSKTTPPLSFPAPQDDPTNMTSPSLPTLPMSNHLSIAIPPPSPCVNGDSGVGGDIASAIDRVINRLKITADLQTQTSPFNNSSHHQLHQNNNNHHNDVQCQTLSSPSFASASSSSSSSSSSNEGKEETNAQLHHENVILKTRINELVIQEKDMFSSLTQRLQELDEARTKLLRLKKSTHQHGLFVQDDTTVWGNGVIDTPLRDVTMDDTNKENITSPPMSSVVDRSTAVHKNNNSSSSSSSSSNSDANIPFQTTTEMTLRMNRMETELKQSQHENKRLRIDMEKTKKRLALERKLSESYLVDLERAREEVAKEMVKNVTMVRQKVEEKQTRRHHELVNLLDNLPVSIHGSMTLDTRSRNGSIDTTHSEEFEHEEEQAHHSLYLEGEGRNGDTHQYNHLLGESVHKDGHHHLHDLLDPTNDRQKGIELAAETMWIEIATTKNDLVVSTTDASSMLVVEME